MVAGLILDLFYKLTTKLEYTYTSYTKYHDIVQKGEEDTSTKSNTIVNQYDFMVPKFGARITFRALNLVPLTQHTMNYITMINTKRGFLNKRIRTQDINRLHAMYNITKIGTQDMCTPSPRRMRPVHRLKLN